MYQVFCRGRKHQKWAEYSGKFDTKKEAEKLKETAEQRRVCDVYGNLIQYKVREVI